MQSLAYERHLQYLVDRRSVGRILRQHLRDEVGQLRRVVRGDRRIRFAHDLPNETEKIVRIEGVLQCAQLVQDAALKREEKTKRKERNTPDSCQLTRRKMIGSFALCLPFALSLSLSLFFSRCLSHLTNAHTSLANEYGLFSHTSGDME